MTDARDGVRSMADLLQSVTTSLEVADLSAEQLRAFRLGCKGLGGLETNAQQVKVARLLLATANLSETGTNVVIAAMLAEQPEIVLEAASALLVERKAPPQSWLRLGRRPSDRLIGSRVYAQSATLDTKCPSLKIVCGNFPHVNEICRGAQTLLFDFGVFSPIQPLLFDCST